MYISSALGKKIKNQSKLRLVFISILFNVCQWLPRMRFFAYGIVVVVVSETQRLAWSRSSLFETFVGDRLTDDGERPLLATLRCQREKT